MIAALVLIEVLMNQSGALLSRMKGYPDFLDWMVWLGTFAATYWIAASLRRVIPLGIKGYLKQQTMVGRHWEKIKTIGSNGEDTAKSIGKRFKAFVAKVWKSLQEVDLTDKSNKIFTQNRYLQLCRIIFSMSFLGLSHAGTCHIFHYIILHFAEILQRHKAKIRQTFRSNRRIGKRQYECGNQGRFWYVQSI